MKRCALLVAVLLPLSSSFSRNHKSARPRIIGIAGATILSSDIPEALQFYPKVVGPTADCNFCEKVPSRLIFLPSGQRLELDQAASTSSDLLAEVSFWTEDIKKLKKFLKTNNVEFQETKTEGKGGGPGTQVTVLVHDPEGHNISFVEAPGIVEPTIKDSRIARRNAPPMSQRDVVQEHLIHAGFVVHDGAAEDRFYKDILGFRLYWHGGMKDADTDWVDMQVPDGTDWIEYMLNVPANADHRTLGVMNHIALGVPDIHAAEKQLLANGWKPGEKPQLGRDGKWQLNLYDPDATRVEFMEFMPTKQPCCSSYTGSHPGPQTGLQPSAQP